MDPGVALAQLLHSETGGDSPVLLGHEQIQQLAGQRAQGLPVDQLHFSPLGAIHHLGMETQRLLGISLGIQRADLIK